MISNSDLTPSQNTNSTTNPQSVDGSLVPNDSSSSQQSAGIDTLSQNHPISVVQTGQPVGKDAAQSNTAAAMWVFVIVSSVVLVMIASSVFKWVMKRPDPAQEKNEKTAGKPSDAKAINPKSKKKKSRSKRHR